MPEMTFVTTYCRPVLDASGNQSSRTFRAGQTYNVEMTPEFKFLQERGNIYPAGTPAPKEPPKVDPPIHSARTDDERNVLSELVDATVDKVLGLPPDQQAALAKRKGFSRPETK